MSKSWVLFFTIIGLAVLTLLLWRSPPSDLTDLVKSNITQPSYPASIISKAKITQYDAQGYLSHALNSETIRHFENLKPSMPDIIFDQPTLNVFEKNTQTSSNSIKVLTLSSDKAEGNEKQDKLTFIGNVVLESVDNGKNMTRLKTDKLDVEPKRRYAETDKPVMISDQSGTLTATGLQVYFDDKKIKLLSNVKGKYVPQ